MGSGGKLAIITEGPKENSGIDMQGRSVKPGTSSQYKCRDKFLEAGKKRFEQELTT